MNNAIVKFFKISAIFSDGLHILVWIGWIALCAGGFLNLHVLNPEMEGTGVWHLIVPAAAMILLLAGDAVRLALASEKHRMIWLSMLLRTVSVVLLAVVAMWLLAPAFRKLYYGE